MIATLDATGTLPLFAGLEYRSGKIEGTLAPSVAEGVVGPSSSGTKIINLEATDMGVSLRFHSGWAYLSHEGDELGAVSTGSKNFYPLLRVLQLRTNWDIELADGERETQQAEPQRSAS